MAVVSKMPRRETEPLTRAHVWLFTDDLQWLKERYSDNAGVSKALRSLIRGFRKRVEDKVTQQLDQESDNEIVEIPAESLSS